MGLICLTINSIASNEMILYFRVLGFYRAPPVVGRVFDLDEDIKSVAEKPLLDTFFKGDCEIQPKDRIVYLRDKAKNLGLNLRDTEIRAKIWEGRKRSKGLVTMLVPDIEIDAPQEIWLVEDLIMKSDTKAHGWQ